MLHNKICGWCKQSFETKLNRKLTCSKQCSDALKHEKCSQRRCGIPQNSLTCNNCRITFLHHNARIKYCCNECLKQSISKRKKKLLSIPEYLQNSDRKIDKNIGYVRLYAPVHREANNRGFVYEHRLIAEQMIGRDLTNYEIVHHKNGCRWDNRPINLEVMDKFAHLKLNGQRHDDVENIPIPTLDELNVHLQPLLDKLKEQQIVKEQSKLEKLLKKKRNQRLNILFISVLKNN